MGFCSPREYLEFMRQAPEFERMMVRSGIRLYKFWFSVSREEQLRRFLGRAQDPLKQWKLSPMDVESLGRWDSYTKAKEAMFFYTDTADAPWTIVRSDDKNRARLHAMRHVLIPFPMPERTRRGQVSRSARRRLRQRRSTSTAKPSTVPRTIKAGCYDAPASQVKNLGSLFRGQLHGWSGISASTSFASSDSDSCQPR